MGRQICFYMTVEDEDLFMNVARRTGEVHVLAYKTDEPMPEEFCTFRDLAGRKYGEACHLWNESISPAPIFKHYVSQDFYCLDFMQSEVVNVLRSQITNGKLSMGRLHIEDRVLQAGDTMALKSQPFVDWYMDLQGWLKERAVKRKKGACVLQGANKLVEEGIELIGHM